LSPRTLIPVLLVFCLAAFSQEPPVRHPVEAATFAANPCAWLPTNIPHADAVAGICQYAMSLPQKMPNFVCDQDASRYRGKNKVPFDLVTASVRYEDGNESYSEIKVNGQPAPAAITQRPGLWSTGEFGSNLRSIFEPQNQTLFEFMRDSTWNGRAAWVFTYRIVKQDVPLWRLHGDGHVLAPPYHGELWVDQKTGELLRFGSVASDIPPTFPTSAAALQIDYLAVSFADGSSFVLPEDFTVTTTVRGQEATRNLVQFRNCHKFRAKSRMVLNVPAGAVSPGFVEDEKASLGQSPEMQFEENEKIYDILREQAVREDAARLELESSSDLRAASAAEISNALKMQRQRQNNHAEPRTEARNAPPSAPPLTTLKVSVRLVPVSVVLRDDRGNAMGDLRKEDFQLFDNGKLQVISSFSVEKSAEAGDHATAGKNPAGAVETFIPQSAPPSARRYVAYVFDDIHGASGDLAQARDAATRHISTLAPDDQTGLFTTSGEIALDFTADRETLRKNLQRIRQHAPVHGPSCPLMTEYMSDLIVNHNDLEALGTATQDAINCAFAGMASTPAERERAEQLAKSAAFEMVATSSAAKQNTLNVLEQVVRRTAAAPGSRIIVLVSPGFLSLTPETRQSVTELVDQAVRANIVVHTLDVRGLYTPGQDANMSHPANPVYRLGLDRDAALTQSEVMAELAYGTGGTFFHNNNDLNEGFRRTASAPECVYILGFSPQKLDGKFHQLTVKLARPEKLTVQARSGYYALPSSPAQ
jgi:VWFA-related protein